MGCKGYGVVLDVEDGKLRFEENVSVDLEIRALVTLHRPDASIGLGSSTVDGLEVKKALIDGGHICIPQGDLEVLQLRVTREGEETLGLVELSTLDLTVVSLRDVVINEKQCCSGVGNRRVTGGILLYLAITNLELVGRNLPETL